MASNKVAVIVLLVTLGLVHSVPVTSPGLSSEVIKGLYQNFENNQNLRSLPGHLVVDEATRQKFQDPQFIEYLESFLRNFQKMFTLLQSMQSLGEDTAAIQKAMTERFGSPSFITFLSNLLQQFTGINLSTISTGSNLVNTNTNTGSAVVVEDFSDLTSSVDTSSSSSTINSQFTGSSTSSATNTNFVAAATTAAGQEEDPEELRRQIQNAHYKFSTYVNDNIRGELQTRKEVRDGAKVTGVYSYDDGTSYRTVWYTADENGFRVTKEEVKQSEKRGHLDGSADVRTYNDGNVMQYHITNADIHHPVDAEAAIRTVQSQ